MGQNMLVFHNDGDSSYANYAGNLSSMSIAATAVTLRFSSTVGTSIANDVVVVGCAAGNEELVLEALAGAAAEARSGMTIVADDKNSKYLIPEITGVTSIAIDNGSGSFTNVITAAFGSVPAGSTANNLTFTNAHSGSTVLIPANGTDANTITLPASPVKGFNLKLVAKADNGNATTTIAGKFDGVIEQGDATGSGSTTTSIVIGAEDFEKGDYINLTYGDSDIYYVDGLFDLVGAVTFS
tara:strand:- start:188 stop:907 length:720 start_codon:yes stop_codon:yes gene_type:complete